MGERTGLWRRVSVIAAAMVSTAMVAGCAGGVGGGAGAGSGFARLFGADRPGPPPDAPSGTPRPAVVAGPSLYCPLLEIRTGTESLTVYERGGDRDPTRLRYQATIRETARECLEAPGGVGVRVGVTGALVGGPRASGNATAPLRVAVLDAEERVIFSQLYQVGGSIGAPNYRAEFAQVIEGIVIPGTAQGAKIYVGFDTQGR